MTESRTVKKTPSSPEGRGVYGEDRAARPLLLLVLALCCLGSLCLYGGSTRLVRESRDDRPHVDPARLDMATQAEAKEVEATEAALTSLGRARGQVMRIAMLAEISGKGPFGRSHTPAAAQLQAEAPEAWEVPEAAPPPAVTVVAVMIQGSERVAMIDAEGEESGLLVREGTRFCEGSARITKIKPEGVEFTWMEGRYEAVVSR